MKKFIPDAEMSQLVELNKHIYDDYYDAAYAISIDKNIAHPIDKHYFRCRFIGFDKLPKRNNPKRPLIYAGNHSGMAFPWDAVMFGGGLLRLNNYDMKDAVRGLVAPPLTETRLMNAFLVKDLWRRVGGIPATTLNFETMMQYQDSNVLIYPEGVPGIGKGFNKKYQLQRFATSFIRMSLKYKTDIIPVHTVNGEYINPYSYSFDWINNLTKKIGIPFLPISWMLLFLPFCPFLFYFAFPAHLTYVRGKRIKPYEMLDKSFEEMTREDIEGINTQVRMQMQQELDEAVEKYGKQPYKWRELFKLSFSNFSKIPFFFSPGWPLLFSEHERRYRKNKGKIVEMQLGFGSFFKTLFKNPLSIAFFLPIVGWIPILFVGYWQGRKKS